LAKQWCWDKKILIYFEKKVEKILFKKEIAKKRRRNNGEFDG